MKRFTKFYKVKPEPITRAAKTIYRWKETLAVLKHQQRLYLKERTKQKEIL